MTRRAVLIVLGIAAASFCYGYLAHKHEWFPHGVMTSIRSIGSSDSDEPRGWFERRATGDATGSSDAELGGIGYLPGVRPAAGDTWVTVHVPERAYQGYNVFTSGHDAEALLMEMDGTVIHSWKRPYADLFPDRDQTRHDAAYWRRGHVFPNGDFLAVFEYLGMVKLDKESNVIWKSGESYHHHIDVGADGRIYTLKQFAVEDDDVRGGEPSLVDAIAILDADGNELESISLLDALRESPWSPVLRDLAPDDPDAFHSNAVVRLDDRLAAAGPAFRAGNFLVSIRNLNLVAVVDADSHAVVWAASGLWFHQHDPQPTDAGTLMVFDNLGLRTRSRIVEFDVRTQDVRWVYEGTADAPFFSELCGTVQPLPNDNVLITETEGGRTFEVTRDGLIVWEFRTPFRAGEDREFIAVMFENERLPPHFPVDWTRGAQDR